MPRAKPVDSVNKKKGNCRRRYRQPKKARIATLKNLKSYGPVQLPPDNRIERAWRSTIRQLGAPTNHENQTHLEHVSAVGVPAASGAWPTYVPSGQASWGLTNHEVAKRHSSVSNTSIASSTCDIQRPRDFSKMPPELQEDPNMWKYWKKRTYLFSKYPEGIKLDKESWYSVTPEPIARKIAERRRYDVIVDAFCGAGGNAIQFAMTCGVKVLAIDIDPIKIECARHNAAIYGVADRIEFLERDFFKFAPFLKADMVFLSPPWGGLDYQKEGQFDIETLQPQPASELLRVARTISSSVSLYLPRKSNREQIQSLANAHDTLDIQKMMGGPKCEGKSHVAIVAYYDFHDKPISPKMAV